MNRLLRALPFALAAALLATSAAAQTIVHYREGERVDAADVARLLAPRTRSIRLLDDPAPAAGAAPAPTPIAHVKTAEDASGLSLPVRFAFGSADIVPAARAQLDALAAGIRMLPREVVVSIEGHTDATGTEAYNRALSKARARSVRDYLVQQHGIEPFQLRALGFGEERPIAGTDPHDGVNRRVEFRSS
jgi:outer membrane protein OmpA-like peptidoglycan-associated protein